MHNPSTPSTFDIENEEVLSAHLVSEAHDERPAFSRALHAQILGALDDADQRSVQIASRTSDVNGDRQQDDVAAQWLSPGWGAALGVAIMALSVLLVVAIVSREFSSQDETGGILPGDTVVADSAAEPSTAGQRNDELVADRSATENPAVEDSGTPNDPDAAQQIIATADTDDDAANTTLISQWLPTTGFLDETLPEVPLPDVSRFDPNNVMDEQVRHLRSDGELVVSLLMSPLSWTSDNTDE